MVSSFADHLNRQTEEIVQRRRIAVLRALDAHDREAALVELVSYLNHSEEYPDLSAETVYITLSSLDSTVRFDPEIEFDPIEVADNASSVEVIVEAEQEFESMLFHGSHS